jgi:hypothetical protein
VSVSYRGPGVGSSKDAKKEKRLADNRASAARSRALEGLKKDFLKATVEKLSDENAALRQELERLRPARAQGAGPRKRALSMGEEEGDEESSAGRSASSSSPTSSASVEPPRQLSIKRPRGGGTGAAPTSSRSATLALAFGVAMCLSAIAPAPPVQPVCEEGPSFLDDLHMDDHGHGGGLGHGGDSGGWSNAGYAEYEGAGFGSSAHILRGGSSLAWQGLLPDELDGCEEGEDGEGLEDVDEPEYAVLIPHAGTASSSSSVTRGAVPRNRSSARVSRVRNPIPSSPAPLSLRAPAHGPWEWGGDALLAPLSPLSRSFTHGFDSLPPLEEVEGEEGGLTPPAPAPVVNAFSGRPQALGQSQAQGGQQHYAQQAQGQQPFWGGGRGTEGVAALVGGLAAAGCLAGDEEERRRRLQLPTAPVR